ncbi:leucine aminopeptidase [Tanacetum coccineum]
MLRQNFEEPCTRNETPLTLSWERIPRLDSGVRVTALDCRYRLSESKDYEEVGRMKYLRPLYTALVQGKTRKEEDKIFAEARETYHPIAQGVVEFILSKHL